VAGRAQIPKGKGKEHQEEKEALGGVAGGWGDENLLQKWGPGKLGKVKMVCSKRVRKPKKIEWKRKKMSGGRKRCQGQNKGKKKKTSASERSGVWGGRGDAPQMKQRERRRVGKKKERLWLDKKTKVKGGRAGAPVEGEASKGNGGGWTERQAEPERKADRRKFPKKAEYQPVERMQGRQVNG